MTKLSDTFGYAADPLGTRANQIENMNARFPFGNIVARFPFG